MRLAGAAVVCVLVAFGAAFMVTRAVYRPAPANAGTTTPHTTTAAVKPKLTKTTAGDPELPSEFAPVTAKLRPKPHRRRVVHRTHPHPATPSAPAYTPPPSTTQAPRTQTTPAPTYTSPAPTYTAPAPTYTPPAPSSGSSGGSTSKKSGSGSGSGGSGSGTTTIGG